MGSWKWGSKSSERTTPARILTSEGPLLPPTVMLSTVRRLRLLLTVCPHAFFSLPAVEVNGRSRALVQCAVNQPLPVESDESSAMDTMFCLCTGLWSRGYKLGILRNNLST